MLCAARVGTGRFTSRKLWIKGSGVLASGFLRGAVLDVCTYIILREEGKGNTFCPILHFHIYTF